MKFSMIVACEDFAGKLRSANPLRLFHRTPGHLKLLKVTQLIINCEVGGELARISYRFASRFDKTALFLDSVLHKNDSSREAFVDALSNFTEF